jgi:DNA-directed RNA polymerase delta subunit
MSTESQGLDPYDAVLADLRAKRDQIDQAIQAIEALRGGAPVAGTKAALGSNPTEGPGAFLGMTIPDAARKLLGSRRQQLSTADIFAAFKAGGLHMTSADPINTIGSVLTRRFNTVGDIVRVGRGIWGLAEWYPNRNFKKKGAKNNEGGAETQAGSEAKDEEDAAEAELTSKDNLSPKGSLKDVMNKGLKDSDDII